ncbi:hypothetical protein [Mycobacterium sp. URHB0021]|jgi:hypothetical protein
MKRSRGAQPDQPADGDIAVGRSVRVYPGTDREKTGVIVEDFGDDVGQPVDIGPDHFADPARRWAVTLTDGTLVFVDSGDLAPT